MLDITDVQYIGLDGIVERWSKLTGNSLTKSRRDYKLLRQVIKESLEMGYGVRVVGVVDIWPAYRNKFDGKEIVIKSKASSNLAKPKMVREMPNGGTIIEVNKVSADELFGPLQDDEQESKKVVQEG